MITRNGFGDNSDGVHRFTRGTTACAVFSGAARHVLLNPLWPNAHVSRELGEPKGGSMNWDQVEGKWKQAAGKVKEKWGKLTDDDVQMISGKRDQLVGKIQERYGIAKEEAERQVEEFSRTYGTDDKTTTVHEKTHGAAGR
jgi:uncharacterized protein YjbJ (UPF0337 family)